MSAVTKGPKVSVILPCYNAENYLRQCMDSILGQTLKDIEVLCVDDGSTDSTLDILCHYETADSRVRVLTQKNGGAGAARNNGLRQARGEYLSFLDADDFFEPDMLEEAVRAAESYDADYVVFDSNRYQMDTNSFVEVPWAVRMEDIPPYMPFSYRQLTDNVFLSFVGWAWDKLYRRSFVEANNLWFQEQRTTNDMLFVFSALVCAKRIAVVDKVLAHQRRGDSGTLSVTRERSWHCFYDALTALKDRLVAEGKWRELEKDYINYALHFSLWHLNSLAEPTHTLLEKKLKDEWFEALGIADKPEHYFYNREEYAQYRTITKCLHLKAPSSAEAPENREIPEAWLPGMGNAEPLEEVCAGFDRLQDRLMEDPIRWTQYRCSFYQKKLQVYQTRKAASALPDVFAFRLCREFRRAQQLDRLDRRSFTAQQWRQIRNLIRSADGKVGWLRSVSLVRWLSPLVPKSLKRAVISVLRSGK